jgi:4-alpha-glucanotransferase
VLRWERHWRLEDQPFCEPADYPPLSVATSGTHDTEPLVIWWEGAPEAERREVSAIGTVQRLTNGRGILDAEERTVRDVLLETLFAAGSNLLLIPVQDVFGWRDRINEPSTVNEVNWTFRLPWPCDRLDDIAEARERQAKLRGWAEQYHRL